MLAVLKNGENHSSALEVLRCFQEGLLYRTRLTGILESLLDEFSTHDTVISGEEDSAVRAYLDRLNRKLIEQHSRHFSTRHELDRLQQYVETLDEEGLKKTFQFVEKWRQGVHGNMYTLFDIGNWLFRVQKYTQDFSAGSSGVSSERTCTAAETKQVRERNLKILLLEMLLRKTRPLSIPPVLVIDPTSHCNFRCRHCAQSSTQQFMHTNLSPHTIKKLEPVLPFAKNAKLFGTGEATLSPFLADLIDIAALSGCEIDVQTNGSTLGKKQQNLEKISHLGISFDGDNRRTMETLRVGSNFKQMCRRINEFATLHPQVPVYFATTVSRVNVDELSGIVKIAGELGVKEVIFNKIIPYMEQLKPLALRRSDEQYLKSSIQSAIELGRSTGVHVTNCISLEFEHDDEEPLDKQKLLAYLEEFSVAGVYKPPALKWLLERTRLYPLNVQPPQLMSLFSDLPAAEPATESMNYSALNEVHGNYYAELIQELKVTNPGELTIPYCTSPWVKCFIEAHGGIRPCDPWISDISSLHTAENFHDAWNSEDLVNLRKATVGEITIPEKCSSCTFVEKHLFLDEIFELLKEHGIDSSQINIPDKHHSLKGLRERYAGEGSGKNAEEVALIPPEPESLVHEIKASAFRKLGEAAGNFYFTLGQNLPRASSYAILGQPSADPAILVALGALSAGNTDSSIFCAHEWKLEPESDEDSFLNFLARLEEANLSGFITPLRMIPSRALSYFAEKSIEGAVLSITDSSTSTIQYLYEWASRAQRIYVRQTDSPSAQSILTGLSEASKSVSTVVCSSLEPFWEITVHSRSVHEP